MYTHFTWNAAGKTCVLWFVYIRYDAANIRLLRIQQYPFTIYVCVYTNAIVTVVAVVVGLLELNRVDIFI